MLGAKIKQYGVCNSAIRVLKHCLSFVGFSWESYYLLRRSLEVEIIMVPPRIECRVERLSAEALRPLHEEGVFDSRKFNLQLARLVNVNIEGYGCYVGEELAYVTWIEIGVVRIEAINFQKTLPRTEGTLVDSFTLPKFRGLGIHEYMNGFRLQRLRELGVVQVYAAVLKENIPALKTQIRHGFLQGKLLTSFLIFRRRVLKQRPAEADIGRFQRRWCKA